MYININEKHVISKKSINVITNLQTIFLQPLKFRNE